MLLVIKLPAVRKTRACRKEICKSSAFHLLHSHLPQNRQRRKVEMSKGDAFSTLQICTGFMSLEPTHLSFLGWLDIEDSHLPALSHTTISRGSLCLLHSRPKHGGRKRGLGGPNLWCEPIHYHDTDNFFGDC